MDNSLGVMIHRTFAAVCKAVDKDGYTFEATITTASLDRYNEVIVPSGVDMEAFKKNPVVFWGHNYDGFPIAKADELMPDSAAIRARFTFPPDGIYQQADIARKLWSNHFINAVSVGIIPIERSEDGKTITKSELLEFSLVGVPANRDALRNSYDREAKEGRVLSKRTRDLLNNAVKQMDEAAQAIQDLLDATSTEEDGDKSAPGDVQSANDLLDQVSLLAAFYKP
jgi:phage head maturation protease